MLLAVLPIFFCLSSVAYTHLRYNLSSLAGEPRRINLDLSDGSSHPYDQSFQGLLHVVCVRRLKITRFVMNRSLRFGAYVWMLLPFCYLLEVRLQLFEGLFVDFAEVEPGFTLIFYTSVVDYFCGPGFVLRCWPGLLLIEVSDQLKVCLQHELVTVRRHWKKSPLKIFKTPFLRPWVEGN